MYRILMLLIVVGCGSNQYAQINSSRAFVPKEIMLEDKVLSERIFVALEEKAIVARYENNGEKSQVINQEFLICTRTEKISYNKHECKIKTHAWNVEGYKFTTKADERSVVFASRLFHFLDEKKVESVNEEASSRKRIVLGKSISSDSERRSSLTCSVNKKMSSVQCVIENGVPATPAGHTISSIP